MTASEVLVDAIRVRDLDRVRELLRNGSSPNGDGRTASPLVIAATQSDSDEIIRVLIAAGAQVNGSIGAQSVPLTSAARFSRERNVEILLEAGADPNRHSGLPALSVAIQNRARKIVVRLLKAGADPNVEHPDGFGALYYAELNGFSELSSILQEHGARLSDWAKVNLALVRRDFESLAAVIQDGFDVRSERGERAFAQTCRSDESVALVELMLRCGAHPNGNRYSGAPLVNSAECNACQNMKALLQSGADPRIGTALGRTPLQVAIHSEVAAEAVRMLISIGCKASVDDHLIWCIREHDLAGVIALIRSQQLDRGYRTTGENTSRWTAAEWAVYESQPEILRELLDAGWANTHYLRSFGEYKADSRVLEVLRSKPWSEAIPSRHFK